MNTFIFSNFGLHRVKPERSVYGRAKEEMVLGVREGIKNLVIFASVDRRMIGNVKVGDENHFIFFVYLCGRSEMKQGKDLMY